jgi:DNA primase
VVLLFDGDDAGKKAMERSLSVLLPEGLRVRIAVLPKGEDPDSFLERRGEDALRALVDSARDAIDEVIRQAVDAGCANPAQKADVVNRVVPLVALIPDPVERVEYARRLANWAATDEQAVQAAVRTTVKGASAPAVEPSRAAPQRATRDERHLRELAVLLFRQPVLAVRFAREPLEALLPAGSWKAVICALLDAGESGESDPSGAVDLFALEERLDEDARARLREVAVDEELFTSANGLDPAFDALIARLEKRHVDARQRELTREMADPEADFEAILREKERLRQLGLALIPPDPTRSPEGGGAARGV